MLVQKIQTDFRGALARWIRPGGPIMISVNFLADAILYLVQWTVRAVRRPVGRKVLNAQPYFNHFAQVRGRAAVPHFTGQIFIDDYRSHRGIEKHWLGRYIQRRQQLQGLVFVQGSAFELRSLEIFFDNEVQIARA